MHQLKLSAHDREVLGKLSSEWVTQAELKTSRQTLNKLLRAGLIEKKIKCKMVRYLPETSSRYRLRQPCTNTE